MSAAKSADDKLYKFIDSSKLSTIVKGADAGDTIIVDVRSQEDHAEAHISGAVNVQAPQFDDDAKLNSLIEKRFAGRESVIFYCLQGQKRSPHCASRVAECLKTSHEGKSLPKSRPEIQVLRGGFESYNQDFGGDPELVTSARQS